MIVQIADIIGNSGLEAVDGTGLDSLILLTILAIGSALTGGLPMLSSPIFEFSLNRVFILSLFFLHPQDPTVYFALASILAGAILRRTASGREFWRYVTAGITMVALLKYGPAIYQKLQPGVPEQIAIITVLPILILIEIIISIAFTGKGSYTSRLSGRIMISYIAALPLSIMTVIMVIHEGILGVTLSFAGLTGFSFIGRSINRKHQWNTQRIREISRQDRMAARLMGSSSYEEFLGILQNNLFEHSGSSVRALTRSSGSFDWVMWSTDEQFGLKESSINGTIPAKGMFTGDFTVKGISGTALGLSDSRDLIIVFSGPEQNILQRIPSSLLENLVLLLGHTWEAVSHSLRSERSFLAAAVTLARLADSKDDYTHGHSLRVAGLSCSLGRYLHISPENIQTLRVASILHDIGKLAIPGAILTKRGLLTKKEREIVEAHPLEGAKIVSGLSGYEEVARIIRSHHERLDGTGYPDGLCKGDIPFMVRIVAVADTFDAITSDRSYRSISGSDNALEIIREEKGSKFDSRIVSALEAILSDEPVSMA
ncbi:MAG: HD-GYP domain-containing protein [Candidatus Aegiribacteria sp.]|nr:HD-GYP domain-containing protein [Candidatus Aegiribacteria sp.]